MQSWVLCYIGHSYCLFFFILIFCTFSLDPPNDCVFPAIHLCVHGTAHWRTETWFKQLRTQGEPAALPPSSVLGCVSAKKLHRLQMFLPSFENSATPPARKL